MTANSQIDHIYVGVVKSRIENKISRLTQQKAINRIKNQIPKEIENIIIDIAKGRLDISKANEIIEKEAQKRVNSKPQTKFTLTEEQEKRQILIQIKTVLREHPEKYYIENDLYALLTEEEKENIKIEYKMNNAETEEVGVVEVYLNEELLTSAKIYQKELEPTKKENFFTRFFRWLFGW